MYIFDRTVLFYNKLYYDKKITFIVINKPLTCVLKKITLTTANFCNQPCIKSY